METDLIIGFFGDRAKTASPFETLKLIFDHDLICFIQEFFVTIREYELGIEFAEIGLEVTEQSKDLLEEYMYRRWLHHMMLLKLEMLDRLNDIKGYLILFDELRTSEDPKWVSPYPTPIVPEDLADYISYRDGDGDAHLQFLASIDWRKKIMLRKWKRFIKGENVEHLKRHQRDTLSDEEILRRANRFFAQLNCLNWNSNSNHA